MRRARLTIVRKARLGKEDVITEQPARADARRNARRLIVAGDAAFRERGVQAPLEDIARSAGVAIGTLYKHFPGRRALVSAVLRDRHDALFEFGYLLKSGDSPTAAL